MAPNEPQQTKAPAGRYVICADMNWSLDWAFLWTELRELLKDGSGQVLRNMVK
jgi:hypothetical protein